MDELFILTLLNNTFFKSWKNQSFLKYPELYDNFSHLEIQISSICDQACSYCYYNRYGDILNPPSRCTKDKLLYNLDLLLNWLEYNEFFPKIDLFSGEIFSQSIGFVILEKVVKWYIKNNIKTTLVIPTNFSFTMDDYKVSRVEDILNYGRDNNVFIHLSASVDGKHLDNLNRPFKNKIRDNEYYDRIFKFAKKWDCAFHPMIYSYGIEYWKDNFLWFQEQFEKYDIPWHRLYLLEVRNSEWSLKNIKEFYNVIRFITKWVINKVRKLGTADHNFIDFIHKHSLFNLFSHFFGKGRGLGCSIQSTMQLRLSDLSVFPCHRTAYPELLMFKFVENANDILTIQPFNVYLAAAIYSSEHSKFPMCEQCSINFLCNGGCLGSNYEYSRELFLVPPTVCLLEHAKVYALIDELAENDLLKYFYLLDKYKSIWAYRNYIKE